MANDVLTLMIDGQVSLTDFARATAEFDLLVRELSGSDKIDWTIQGLDYSSAITSVIGQAEDIQLVERVAREYIAAADAIIRGAQSASGLPGYVHAMNLIKLAGKNIHTVRFITAEGEAETRGMTPDNIITKVQFPRHRNSYGSVEGRVQTVSEARGLRFVLYDRWSNKAVNCYLREGYREIMRDAWGRRAIVEGSVSRDRVTGQPVAVRDVVTVGVRPEPDRFSFQRARGVLPSMVGERLPEDRLRTLRDAEG